MKCLCVYIDNDLTIFMRDLRHNLYVENTFTLLTMIENNPSKNKNYSEMFYCKIEWNHR